MIIIGVYAPSDDADPLTKDMFFNKLTHIISDIKHDKELFLLGDFNSRTGTETNSPVVGQYGERSTNDNGLRLRGMCESLNLKIMNGFFPHRDIHKLTWTQPTRQLRSIIDYLIQRQNSKLKTIDVRAYRGAECGSDHHLVVSNNIYI
ncbi:craniofacial development protein 2-like [Sitophilus oryzae]|uniref:Craniofacial development protein 2-like n=1 Tax=Sitophilus oryzae TaxID=7048 RepID=A0A6J2YTD2_SITOR|nr:craniofacial development protein 2-like [Sitophilus oryzae]